MDSLTQLRKGKVVMEKVREHSTVVRRQIVSVVPQILVPFDGSTMDFAGRGNQLNILIRVELLLIVFGSQEIRRVNRHRPFVDLIS